jgi:hypothetical protein
LIESYVWGTMVANEQPLDDLAELNYELAQIITAVLKLGDPALFKPEMQWLEYLLMSHRLSAEALRTYITTYAQAARIHLGAASGLVVDWLNNLSEQ